MRGTSQPYLRLCTLRPQKTDGGTPPTVRNQALNGVLAQRAATLLSSLGPRPRCPGSPTIVHPSILAFALQLPSWRKHYRGPTFDLLRNKPSRSTQLKLCYQRGRFPRRPAHVPVRQARYAFKATRSSRGTSGKPVTFATAKAALARCTLSFICLTAAGIGFGTRLHQRRRNARHSSRMPPDETKWPSPLPPPQLAFEPRALVRYRRLTYSGTSCCTSSDAEKLSSQARPPGVWTPRPKPSPHRHASDTLLRAFESAVLSVEARARSSLSRAGCQEIPHSPPHRPSISRPARQSHARQGRPV